MNTNKILKTILAVFVFAVPVMADELDRSTAVKIIWTPKNWPANGRLIKPKGIGNITAAYFANDAARKPLTVEFNRDATVVTLHVPKKAPAQPTIALELAEKSTRHPDGRIVFSALNAKVHGTKAKLETHPGNHRIGFWVNPADFVQWNSDLPRAGNYDVELTYSAAGPSGTKAVIEIAKNKIPITLKTTGSWYRYTTLPVGHIRIPKTGPQTITVKCTKKVGGAVMNLKAVTLRPR
jgi:hypothetical protein